MTMYSKAKAPFGTKYATTMYCGDLARSLRWNVSQIVDMRIWSVVFTPKDSWQHFQCCKAPKISLQRRFSD